MPVTEEEVERAALLMPRIARLLADAGLPVGFTVADLYRAGMAKLPGARTGYRKKSRETFARFFAACAASWKPSVTSTCPRED